MKLEVTSAILGAYQRLIVSFLILEGSPVQVRQALWLIFANCLVGEVRVALMDHKSFLSGALAVALLFIISALWLYGLSRRLNWVRWVTVVLGVIGCADASREISRLDEPVQVGLYWFQWVFTLLAVGLLVLPAAHRWYTRKS